MRCDECGYEGSRAEFRFIKTIEDSALTERLCPKCKALTTCDEVEEDEAKGPTLAWGMKALGRKSRRKEVKQDADV